MKTVGGGSIADMMAYYLPIPIIFPSPNKLNVIYYWVLCI